MNLSSSIKVDKYKIRNFLIITFALILASGVMNNFDYIAYKMSYNGLISTNFEVGYSFLENTFSKLGIPFNIYKAVVSFLFFLFISKTVNRYINQKYKFMYYLSFIIVPITFFSYSLRSSIGFSIVIFSFPYLLNQKARYTFLYVILVLFATMFHQSMFVFLIFSVIPMLRNSKLYINNEILIFGFLMMFVVFFTLNRELLQQLSDFFWSQILYPLGIATNKEGYFIVSVNVGHFLFYICHFVSVSTLILSKKTILQYMSKTKTVSLFNTRILAFLNYVISASVLLTFILPVFAINTEFTRILRGILPLQLIALIAAYSIVKGEKIYRLNFRLVILLFLSINFIIYVLPYLDEVFYPMFLDNWIFDILFGFN